MNNAGKKKFATTISILLIINLLIKFFTGFIFLSVSLYLIFYILYISAIVLLLFKQKITGWYMTIFYSGYTLLFGLANLVYLYKDLIANSSANWGGLLSFIFPLPNLIIDLVIVIICLKKATINLFEIKI